MTTPLDSPVKLLHRLMRSTLLLLAVCVASIASPAHAQFRDIGLRVAVRPVSAVFYEITLDLTRDMSVKVEIITTDELGPFGDTVRTLHALGPRARGSHTLPWDGTDDAGAALPPGTYAVMAFTESGGTMVGTHALLDVGGVSGPTAAPAVMSQPVGPCRELWINWAFKDVFGRDPVGAGDVGECNPQRYGGQWASFDELVERVRRAAPLSAEERSHATDGMAAPPASPDSAPVAPRATHRIRIDGDAACREQTERALDLLLHLAPGHYAVADRYVGVIECFEGGDGMGVGESPPRYRVGSATRNSGVIWYASTIAHDAFHSKQFNDYRAANPGRQVPTAVYL
ncbi:MAG: hypothetical protein AVDCRST_MAG77-4741 [uncultured Chloroflexi bacterium]|uniref:FlgD/Vpr Ig-like domain-containing protein n=1 Tax=uncultured Chloroflexota bacterium TaxID=166587 RepID=A0A6J4JZ81_9CHLR|nr:MAG: hypothetical protein AVDCRST_MAG77-4741 [uncultured Chloroflexota bacterium]